MTLYFENTTAADINASIGRERHRIGATATGMVLTLVVMADEVIQSDATGAAVYSAREHPCRILIVIPRAGRGHAQLDAEISVGDPGAPGETIKLRLRGPLSKEPASVVLPLLVPDTPVVAWWPSAAPAVPAAHEVGQFAKRRITDAAAARKPLAALAERKQGYTPGDTDLAWTRLTPWRSTLATALDQPFDPIRSATVSADRNNPSAPLLAAWLRARLHVPVTLISGRGPGITGVRLIADDAEIELARPDEHLATLRRPGTLPQTIALPRRELRELVSEELRRLNPDDIYEQALAAFDPQQPGGDEPPARPAPKSEPTHGAK